MCGQLDAPSYDPPAGRRRVLYLELPDVPPPPEPDDREPDMPEPVDGCLCHDAAVCPDEYAALYESEQDPELDDPDLACLYLLDGARWCPCRVLGCLCGAAR